MAVIHQHACDNGSYEIATGIAALRGGCRMTLDLEMR